jgi:hypothetical protein
MTVTATGHEAIALTKLMQMVSESTAFQAATGTTAAAGALDYIYAPEKRNETEAQQQDQSPPVFAVITFPDGASETELVAGGGKNWFTLSGRLRLMLIRQKQGGSKYDEMIEALNLFGAVRLHLLNDAAVDDSLAIVNVPMTGLFESSDLEVAGYRVQKPFHRAEFDIEWRP